MAAYFGVARNTQARRSRGTGRPVLWWPQAPATGERNRKKAYSVTVLERDSRSSAVLVRTRDPLRITSLASRPCPEGRGTRALGAAWNCKDVLGRVGGSGACLVLRSRVTDMLCFVSFVSGTSGVGIDELIGNRRQGSGSHAGCGIRILGRGTTF